MKIYTKTGDSGETGLFAGGRVPKDDARIEAYGTVDELNSILGMVRSRPLTPELDGALAQIQHALFAVGGELATPDAAGRGMRLIGPSHISRLEQQIDDCERQLAPLSQFILPGGCSAAAELHLARTICRRAERRVVTLQRTGSASVAQDLIVYLNRLSDLLFVMARLANQQAGVADVVWEKPTSSP